MAAVTVTHKVTHFWTAFFSLLSAILTALGLKRTPEAAITVYAGQATATAAPAVAPIPAPRCCAPAWTSGYARSLPPTIKQRIRAEAHGASPSVRRLTAALVSDPADVTDGPDETAVLPHQAADRTDLTAKADTARVTTVNDGTTGRADEAGTADRAADHADPVRRTGLALAA
ncbi:DUF6344 domain-containing protein [Streptomyces sp. NPDC000229]|uniref:DUF6344 domain-containing protein n=1 Tax=Streptomyces sp. NPDC000229 TaxID=3154247 RepID=UPI00331C0EAD